jgi:hypothetical protein
MSHELLYTSVPPGLIPGVKGYCTVARTEGLPDRVALLLEQHLSDYRYNPAAGPSGNPVVSSHVRLLDSAGELSILSRKSPVDDHSGRQSVFAHHVVLGPGERPDGGPAWVLAQGLMLGAWDGRVGAIAAGRRPRAGDRPPGRCTAWERAGVDPGWAGALAEAFLAAPDRPAYLVYRPGRDLLPLLEDAVALLPVSRRWSLTFSTCFTGLPPNVPCAWRCVPAGSPEAQQAALLPQALVIHLDRAGEARGEGLVELARTGKRPAGAGAAATSVAEPDRPFSRPRYTLPGTSPRGESSAVSEAALIVTTGPAGLRRGRDEQSALGAWVLASSATALLFLGVLGGALWWANRGDESVGRASNAARQTKVALAPPPRPEEAPDRNAARPPVAPQPDAPKSTAPEPAKKAPEPETAPADAEPEAREVRFAHAGLPPASTSPAQHDTSDHTLEVVLPAADRYALRLRGIDDAEAAESMLVALPAEPGRTDALTVYRDPHKAGGKALGKAERLDLARVWVEDGRLHFRWAAELSRSLALPSRALRDCILEVRAGKTVTNVALRDALVDRKAVAPGALKGARPVGWKRDLDRPSRKMTVRSCQVMVGNDWRDVPPKADPNHRELTFPATRGDGEEDGFILRVRLADDGSELRAEVEPSLKQFDRMLDELGRDAAGFRAEIADLKPRITAGEFNLRNEQNNRDVLVAHLQLVRSQMPAGAGPLNGATPILDAAQKDVDAARGRCNDLARDLDVLRSRLKDAERGLAETRDDRKFYTQLRQDAERCQAAPIRARLGITVDGEEVDVARIGPG